MDMEFDLSFSDPSVVEMSRLHNVYASESDNIRRMISFLRIWAKVNNLTEHGLTKKLTPYILTQERFISCTKTSTETKLVKFKKLACNYLQSAGLVPKLDNMMNASEKKYKFCNYDIGFRKTKTPSITLQQKSLLATHASEKGLEVPEVENKLHILSLLYGFFDYVQNFYPQGRRYRITLVTTYTTFIWYLNLTLNLNLIWNYKRLLSRTGYYLKSSSGATLIRKSKAPSVFITHPFDESINVAAGVDFDFFTVFQSFCAETKEEILYILSQGLDAVPSDQRIVSYF